MFRKWPQISETQYTSANKQSKSKQNIQLTMWQQMVIPKDLWSRRTCFICLNNITTLSAPFTCYFIFSTTTFLMRFCVFQGLPRVQFEWGHKSIVFPMFSIQLIFCSLFISWNKHRWNENPPVGENSHQKRKTFGQWPLPMGFKVFLEPFQKIPTDVVHFLYFSCNKAQQERCKKKNLFNRQKSVEESKGNYIFYFFLFIFSSEWVRCVKLN